MDKNRCLDPAKGKTSDPAEPRLSLPPGQRGKDLTDSGCGEKLVFLPLESAMGLLISKLSSASSPPGRFPSLQC